MVEESGFQLADGAAGNYEQHIWKFMGPQVEALVSSAVRQGDTVLDVACGTGFAARVASQLVGATGRVVGTDINPGMVAMARSVPHDDGPPIEWLEASALELPFDDGEFDVVVCSQGAQFFPDSSAGLQEMGRVARQGGRVAITVWAPRPQSPFLDAQFDMLIEFCDVDRSLIDAAFAGDGKRQLREWFAGAGLQQVDVQSLQTTAVLPPLAEFSPAHLTALPWSQPFFDLDPDARRDAIGYVEHRLADYRTSTGAEVPFTTYLATADC